MGVMICFYRIRSGTIGTRYSFRSSYSVGLISSTWPSTNRTGTLLLKRKSLSVLFLEGLQLLGVITEEVIVAGRDQRGAAGIGKRAERGAHLVEFHACRDDAGGGERQVFGNHFIEAVAGIEGCPAEGQGGLLEEGIAHETIVVFPPLLEPELGGIRIRVCQASRTSFHWSSSVVPSAFSTGPLQAGSFIW